MKTSEQNKKQSLFRLRKRVVQVYERKNFTNKIEFNSFYSAQYRKWWFPFWRTLSYRSWALDKTPVLFETEQEAWEALDKYEECEHKTIREVSDW